MKKVKNLANNEVTLPMLDTVWYIMANHARQKNGAHTVLTYDDLMYFKYLLNINLRAQCGEDVPHISVATSFKDKYEQNQAYLDNPYADLVSTNHYDNEDVMPPLEEVKKAYRVLIEHKAKKQGAKAYDGAIEREVDNNILLENYDDFLIKYGEEYFKPEIYKKLHDEIYIHERYKYFADCRQEDPYSNNLITFADLSCEVIEDGLEKLADNIVYGNRKLDKDKVKLAINDTLSKMEELNIIEDNIKFSVKLIEIGKRYKNNLER